METFIHIIPAWIELMSLAVCIGALVCRLLVLDPSHTAAIPYYKKLLIGIWRSLGVAIAATIISSIVDLLTRTAEMSGMTFEASLSLVPTVIGKTHFGYCWLIGAIALVLIWIGWWLSRRYPDSRALSGFMLCLAALFAFSLSASGHASDAGDFTATEMMDWFHLVAASVWGGGLAVLSTIILPRLIKPDDHQKAIISDIARRFSQIAGIFLGVVVITACYNSWYFVGSFQAFWKTSYGFTADAKIILLLFLLALGAFNRYINVPLLHKWAGWPLKKRDLISRLSLNIYAHMKQSGDGRLVALRFMRSVKIEAFLMVVVLLCAALLRHDIPSRHTAHHEHSGKGMTSQPPNKGGEMHNHMDHQH